MITKINEMKQMQKALDEAIYSAKGCEFDADKTFLALFDELGELTHELKGEWCWWKDTQAEVDKQRVLEELVDVWHFALSIDYNVNNVYEELHDGDIKEIKEMYGKTKLSILLSELTGHILREPIAFVIALTSNLGYTIDEVYTAYIEKNKVNYERLSGGY